MANLVGVSNATSYTTAASANSITGTRIVHDSFVASQSGTATALYLYVRANNTPNVKLCIYSNAGALLASTAPIAITVDGWITASISSVSIVSGTTYKLGWYADAGYTDYYTIASPTDAYEDTVNGTYTSPAANITSNLDSGIDNFAMYADGTVSGGIDPGVIFGSCSVLGNPFYQLS